MADHTAASDERLQNEFNRWAEEGEGEKMERHHLDITAKTIRLMDLRPGERVLDLGCGSGWATRLLARLVAEGPEGFGQVVGVDVADEIDVLVVGQLDIVDVHRAAGTCGRRKAGHRDHDDDSQRRMLQRGHAAHLCIQ